MQIIETIEQFEHLKQQEDALLVLFGGKNCNVCHVIRPKVEAMVAEAYPKAVMVYVDCHLHPELGAQESIFSLPVLRVYFGGQKFIEEVRSFSVQKVVNDMQRPYKMVFVEA
jgi:thioredoxin 1